MVVQAKFCHWEFQVPEKKKITGSLRKGVFERRTSTLSDAFSFLLCVDASKFVLLSGLTLKVTIYPKHSWFAGYEESAG